VLFPLNVVVTYAIDVHGTIRVDAVVIEIIPVKLAPHKNVDGPVTVTPPLKSSNKSVPDVVDVLNDVNIDVIEPAIPFD
jgi:hypothetical protein